MKASTKKYLIIGSVSIIVIGLIYYLYRTRKKNNDITPDQTTVPTNTNPTQNVTDDFPLKKGSSGTRVKNLQIALNKQVKAPYVALTVDGIFGNKTLETLQRIYKVSEVSEKLFQTILSFRPGKPTDPTLLGVTTKQNPVVVSSGN